MTEPASPPGRFPPLAPDHPLVGADCALCDEPFVAGDVPTLVSPRPADADEAAKADRGEAHTAEVDPAHERCARP